MISLTKKHICLVTSTISRGYSGVSKIKTDPGISKRKAVVNPMGLEEDFQDMEFDDLETDFMHVHKSYKQHLQETDRMNERLKYLIVKNKYFKEKHPNFLTWNDKEQIKLLHSTYPEEWTVDKLSESFPASPEVIKKVTKAKYSKSDLKMKNHDVIVEKNWEKFKNGGFTDLPPDLVEHLKKFTTRKVNTQHYQKKTEVVNKPRVQSEFLEIITSYENLKNKTESNENKVPDHKHSAVDLKTKSKNSKNTPKDTFLTIKKQNIKDKTPITLSQLQHDVETKANKGAKLTEEEKVIYKDINQPEESSLVPNQQNVTSLSENKYNSSTGSSLMKKTERDYAHLVYPQRITIPQELRKRGYTYRLNDCYYDYDGEFLYRVPGMG